MHGGKFISPKEEQFWRLRFDPQHCYTIKEIEEITGTDHWTYQNIQKKLRANIILDQQTDLDLELIKLAKEVTGITGEITKELIEEVVRKRAFQVNWERRYRHLK